MIPLTKPQREIMAEFYSKGATQVVFNKAKRKEIWALAIKREEIPASYNLNVLCPALEHQILKSYESGGNIQSAIFSECVYAQTLANMFNLSKFIIHIEEPDFLTTNIIDLLNSYNLHPRYIYSSEDNSRMLIQAGGPGGIDSALFTIIDLNVYTIEFKESGAKTSEPDLPKYKEDGKLLTTPDFQKSYPQFTEMLSQHIGTSMFDVMGNNIHNFTPESVNIAVSNNYVKKFADVCCTEDKNGYLTMIPCNQISVFAKIEGEIRPAGRNPYKVWTPIKLKEFILERGGTIEDSSVSINKNKLTKRRARGGNRMVTGYKISPLFFVRKTSCNEVNEILTFDINDVRQLNPTIAGKVFFTNLLWISVKTYYSL